MEAQPESPSAADPRWVMLEQYLEIIKVQDSSSSPTDGDDTKTLAAARTSNCHPIQVSLRLAEPPALSRVLLRIPDGIREEKSKVLAAHGDSVLIQVRIKEKNQQYDTFEHFVYNAGAHAAEPPRPPSLWLLPPYYEQSYFSGSDLVTRELFDGCTGLLRSGEDELVVAELWVSSLSDDTPRTGMLYLFRSGEWKHYCFEIREDWEWDLPSWVSWDTVVPVDDRRLCWVDLSCGVMLLDVSEETLMVEYVRLPTDPRDCKGLNRNVCTTAGGGALKFVNIFGRCCCGAAASCDCEHSRHAYTIHTWTMRIGNGDMEWVKDGMVDATELWALDAYKGLPCNPLDRPIVSIDEPEVICFRLRGAKCGSQTRTLWQIMVNMRSKTICSVSRHEEEFGYCYTRDKLIPSNVSYFFNPNPSSGRSDDATLTGQSQIYIERSPSVLIDERPIGDGDASNQALQASEIIEALQEIPSYGLGREEVNAYRILSNDNGRRLRSLLRLPKNIRKNWLLMEIKASQG